MTFHIPRVDISAYVDDAPDGRPAVAAAIDEACRTAGFIQIVGHGVPQETIDRFVAAMDRFFALDLDAKKAYRTPPSINRGYSPPKSESLSLSLGVESATRMNDFFEAFNVGASVSDYPDTPGLSASDYPENVWPEVEDYEPAVTAYFAEARRVARILMRIFADALGLAPDYFAGRSGHSIDVLRMNNYALPAGTDIALDGDLTGMGEHTDFGMVTVLWADQVKGLQVLGTDGEWHDAEPDDGAFLVNLGDVMARMTNERWMSTLHRVKPPIVGGTIERRRSAAFFHDGDVDAIIDVLPGCVDDAHPALYEPVTVGEHITAKLRGSRVGLSNAGAARESARVLASRR